MAAHGNDRLTAGREAAPAPKKTMAKTEPVPAGLALQRAAGNRAVVGLLQAQAKLSVGSVDDPLEAEADRVADAVVAALRSPTAPAAEVPGASAVTDARRRVARMVEGLSVARAVGPEGGEVDTDVEQALQSARGSGRPVPEGIRRQMEAATGADFTTVRLHAGSEAASLSERLGAKAFTVGRDIFFRSGLPDTATAEGQHLLAHELAHTVQQGAAARRSSLVQREEEKESSEEESEAGPEEKSGEEEEETETEFEGALEEEKTSEEQPSTAPPAGLVADRTGSVTSGSRRNAGRRSAVSGQGTGARALTVSLDLGLEDRESRTSQAEAQAIEDKIASSFTLTGSTRSGKDVTPFGAMGPRIEFNDLRYKAKAKKNGEGTATVKGTVLFDCHWGTNSGGRKDIASANSPEVTKDTYQQIVSDLTPRAVEKSWVARRQQYYADHLTARHEKFHAADARSWAKDQGKTFLKNYLGKQTVVIADDERTDAGQLKAKMQPIADDAYNAYRSAFWTYMTGVGLTYYSYPCEEKAFGDGKEPYQKLADAVEKRGKELEKKAAAKAKKP